MGGTVRSRFFMLCAFTLGWELALALEVMGAIRPLSSAAWGFP